MSQTIACKYLAPYQDSSGYGSASRAFITSLHLANVDVTTELTVHMKEKAHHGWEGELAYALQNRDIPYKVKILHITPDLYQNYLEPKKYHIGRVAWETDRLPKGWERYLNTMGEVWTSSPQMIEIFKRSGVKIPMYYFPEPIDITTADKDWKKFGIVPPPGFIFYSVFQWIERKNPKALLRAYWKAFEGREDVTLLLKVFRLSYDEDERRKIRNNIIEWKNQMGGRTLPRILVCFEILSQEQMMQFHATGDCFVSAHRGEGWGRPIQEALLLGKPVIATSRGGIHEYLKPEHYFGIDSSMVPVTEVPYIKFYTQDQMWAEIDEAQLIKTMQYVFKNREKSGAKGVLAKEYCKENFSYHKIGEQMRMRLQEIYRNL